MAKDGVHWCVIFHCTYVACRTLVYNAATKISEKKKTPTTVKSGTQMTGNLETCSHLRTCSVYARISELIA